MFDPAMLRLGSPVTLTPATRTTALLVAKRPLKLVVGERVGRGDPFRFAFGHQRRLRGGVLLGPHLVAALPEDGFLECVEVGRRRSGRVGDAGSVGAQPVSCDRRNRAGGAIEKPGGLAGGGPGSGLSEEPMSAVSLVALDCRVVPGALPGLLRARPVLVRGRAR